ncbi:hypothetical protein ACFOY2_14735 [Nonomuraea purpurea]|uniref:Uncharacterized protein n=1 Tax=Nonomuraea purpurea TaxID=1849276 RepID=A0ABV8G6P0_9ACTN
MRRRPSICDACARLRQQANPKPVSPAERYVPFCTAFPDGVPDQIYFGGFDHRRSYPGDRNVLFDLREGGERALTAYERYSGI